MPTVNQDIRAGARDYVLAWFGHDMPETEYARVDVGHATRTAEAYADMLHRPELADVQEAYRALRTEIVRQWHHATAIMGYTFTPWTAEGQPYANSQEMRADVLANKRLYFFTGGDMPENHALAETHAWYGLTYNDMLRAIHDLFGHAQGGFDFGPRGEENAYREHRKMFSDKALPALTTETRGQNSWVNYGPYKDIPAAERPFAEQKCGLLPAWCWE